ncbi:MAG: DUF4342 domain-containing protein [Anaerolineae bacterium]|nr:DUF4342 domain-containing protein [Anaerolineae bacterium]
MSEENETPEVEKTERTIIEELEVAGSELVKRIEDIVEEGNARRIVIKHGERVLLEIPLTLAAVGGFVTALLAPQLAMLGALAALLTQVTVIVLREEPEKKTEKETKVKIEVEEE